MIIKSTISTLARKFGLVLAVAFIVFAVGACGGAEPSGTFSSQTTQETTKVPVATTEETVVTFPSQTEKPQVEELAVAADQPLAAVLRSMGPEYFAKNPFVNLVYNINAADKIKEQLVQGAFIDVVIISDGEAMGEIRKDNLVDLTTVKPVVGNKLVLLSAADSTTPLTGVADLGTENIRTLGIINPETSVSGRLSAGALDALALPEENAPALQRFSDAGEVLTALVNHQIDGAILLNSEGVNSAGIKVISDIPQNLYEPIIYSAAVAKTSPNPDLAANLIAFWQSEAGQEIFNKYGFTKVS